MPEAAKWSRISGRLKKEKKQALLDLLQELQQRFPDVQDFLQTRYMNPRNVKTRVAAYRAVIAAEFTLTNDGASLDLDVVQRAIRDYQQSTGNDVQGTVELLIFTLETVGHFVNEQVAVHDPYFYGELIEIATDCMARLDEAPTLSEQQAERLPYIQEALGPFSDDLELVLSELGWDTN